MKVYQFLLMVFCTISILNAANNTSLFHTIFSQDVSDDSKPFNPSDGIQIDAFPDTTSFLHDKVFPIDDKGYVEFPMLGKIKITDMTVKELSDFLKNSYKNYLRYPMLKIKPVVRVSLLGGFRRPGLYYVDLDKSLWEVVYLAGGPVIESGIYDMHWERNEEENTDELTKIFERGISLRKMGFKSGDQIWTPSPGARTWLTAVTEVLPILTIATSIWYMYVTYQNNQLLYTRTRTR